jgi:group I intron endonuclease
MSKTENAACEVIGRTQIKREDLLLKGITRGIYGLRNKITGKWYVGQSWDIANRWNRYAKYECTGQRKLSHAIKKYGWESFETYIIEEITCPSQIVLDRLEINWIQRLNSIKTGYNIMLGGAAGKHSDETKKLLSHIARNSPTLKDRMEKLKNSKIGTHRSESTKEKLRKAHLGRKHSEESRKNMSSSNIGRIVSESTRSKISASRKKYLSNSENRKHLSSKTTIQMSSQEARNNLSKKAKIYYSTEEARKKHSERMKLAYAQKRAREKFRLLVELNFK